MIKIAAAAVLLCGLFAGPAEASEPLVYAALGDSVAAGPLIPAQRSLVCNRSDHNYPTMVANALHAAEFTDVSCTGAELKHLTTSQSGEPPQLAALSDRTTLVTITLGANSIRWAKVAFKCGLISIGTFGRGNPCQLTQGKQVLKQMSKLQPQLNAAYQRVRAKAPNARILVVGYLKVAPTDGRSCWPKLPLADGDEKFFDSIERKLNAMLELAAANIDATYVDTYTPSEGHDVCAKEPWSSGLVGPSLIYHPTEEGMRRMAATAVAAYETNGVSAA